MIAVRMADVVKTAPRRTSGWIDLTTIPPTTRNTTIETSWRRRAGATPRLRTRNPMSKTA